MRPYLFIALSVGIASRGVAQQNNSASSMAPSEAARLFGLLPKITLKLKDAPLSEALISVLEQADMPVPSDVSALKDRRVTLELRNVPFWKAVRELERVSGWTLSSGVDATRNGRYIYSMVERRNPLDSRMDAGGWEQEQGPIFAVLDGIARNVTIQGRVSSPDPLVAQKTEVLSDWLVTGAHFYLDPRVSLVRAQTPQIRVLDVISENGESLLKTTSSKKIDTYQIYPGATSLTVPLPVSGDLGRKLAKVRVEYKVLTATEPITLEWADISQPNLEVKAGPRGIGIEAYSVERAGLVGASSLGIYEVRLLAKRPADGLDYRNYPPCFPVITLTSATGGKWRESATGFDDRLKRDDPAFVREYEALYQFSLPPEIFRPPFKLEWKFPSRLRPLEATFEWNDLPLPQLSAAITQPNKKP